MVKKNRLKQAKELLGQNISPKVIAGKTGYNLVYVTRLKNEMEQKAKDKENKEAQKETEKLRKETEKKAEKKEDSLDNFIIPDAPKMPEIDVGTQEQKTIDFSSAESSGILGEPMPDTEGVDKVELEKFRKAVSVMVTTIDKAGWKVGLGVTLSDDEEEAMKTITKQAANVIIKDVNHELTIIAVMFVGLHVSIAAAHADEIKQTLDERKKKSETQKGRDSLTPEVQAEGHTAVSTPEKKEEMKQSGDVPKKPAPTMP